MKRFLAVVVSLSALQASTAFADDSKNTADMPAALTMPAIVPAPKAAAPATPSVPTTPKVTPPTSGTANDSTAVPQNSTASDKGKHHRKRDNIGDHLHDGTSTSGSATGNTTTPIVDNNGHIRYICGTPMIDDHHNLIGSYNCSNASTTTIVGDSSPAIISDGIWTFPPGRTYQDTNGKWQICDGNLIIDTRKGTTTCKPLNASGSTINIINPQQPAQYQPVTPPPRATGLSSDSNSSLRSDSNVLR